MPLSRAQQEAELARRTKKPTTHLPPPTNTAYPFLSELHEGQAAVLASPSRRKALLCGRRWGKSRLMRTALAKKCLDVPGARCLFLGPTRKKAEQLIWRDLHELNDAYSLGCKFNESKLEMTFPNGSLIRLEGCDTEADADKSIRGEKYRLICIDEAGHIGDHLDAVIQRVIDWTLIDFADSELWLSGTPNHHCTGYFWDVTKDISNPPYGWAVWHGTLLDNPRLPLCVDSSGNTKPDWRDLARAELEELKKKEGWDDQSPTYRREALAEWFRDDSTLVIAFEDRRNTYSSLPIVDSWHCVLGIDVGFNDPFAIVCCYWSPQSPRMFVVEAFEQAGLLLSQQAGITKSWWERHKKRCASIQIVADPGGGGKLLIEELSRVHNLPIFASKKVKKYQHLELLSDDFRQGKIVVQQGLGDFIDQLKTLTWKDKLKEQMVGPDHLADALLYAFREAQHHSGKPSEQIEDPGMREALASARRMVMEQSEFSL